VCVKVEGELQHRGSTEGNRTFLTNALSKKQSALEIAREANESRRHSRVEGKYKTVASRNNRRGVDGCLKKPQSREITERKISKLRK